jgi:hypothetical protein
MAARQPLDLATQARALVFNVSFIAALLRIEVLLPTNCAPDFEENGEELVHGYI